MSSSRGSRWKDHSSQVTSVFGTGIGDSYAALGMKSPKNHSSPKTRPVELQTGWVAGPCLLSSGRREGLMLCGTHLPAGWQPASREPVFPAHLPVPAHTGIPALGFNCDPVVSATPSQHCSPTHHQRPPLPPAPSRKHRTGKEGETLRARQALRRKSSGRAQCLPRCHNTWVYLNISGLETSNFSCL